MELEELRKMMIYYRAKYDITQEELAKRCKLSIQTICMVEQGKQKPNRMTVAKILKIIQED